MVLALDEVWDPQNFGALLRTAHFFAVRQIVCCAKNSAPLSPVVSKASAGAMELLAGRQLLQSTNNMMKFLEHSKLNGWQVRQYCWPVRIMGNNVIATVIVLCRYWAQAVVNRLTRLLQLQCRSCHFFIL